MISSDTHKVAGWVSVTLSILGFLTNMTTFSVLMANRKLRRQVTTIIILFLSGVNIVYNGVMQPFHAYHLIACPYCHEDSLPCSMMGFCFYATTGSVLYIQAFLAATRYILVCSSWKITPTSTILISALVSLLPYLIFTFPLFEVWGGFGYEPGTVPFIIIIFSYVMIVRKYRISRNKVMQNSASLKSRTSLGGGRLSVMETSFFPGLPGPSRPQSVYTSCTLSVPDTSRRVSEDDISMCEMTNDLLERTQTERRRRRRRQEGDMNMTVMIICISFVICHLPACLVLVFDPSANKFPQAHMPSYALAWVNPVIAPWVYVTFNIQYRKAFIDTLKRLKILNKTDYL